MTERALTVYAEVRLLGAHMNTPTDEQVGESLRDAREACGLSQRALGDQMRESGHGHEWSQPTVWAVETGRRHLRWTEAVTLNRLVGFSIGSGTNETLLREAAAYRRVLAALSEGSGL
ncbi:helix-turn-helix transcriptional regulator [Microbacterium sp. VKM Ac-2923]|uniref:helix-turn-helix domain-containing protein n=1 Tax=Microbacterium sp. VKM Ac-2923 TaxID=2929476 RepID=UPI001FB2D237|nr:helix-turn-helix transcriptional regulator [Microbacterium sp. VKM Ac-2923]MCJ1709288.1 helix-turn-helix domain-containing protein [Microbacterium sp. VKM Ac-2923]